MLTKFHKVLIGMLVVQLALVAFVMLRSNDVTVVKEQPLLAGFDVAKVTRLQVFDHDTTKKPIDLVKKVDKWTMASAFDYPVEASKVTDVLTPIGKMAAAEPVATNKSRHKQLKVDDGDYERKLVITADGKDTTIYIGSTAGARKTAVRLGADDRVYGVTGVNSYAAGTEARQWIDTKYSDVTASEIAKVTIARPAGAGGGTVELFKSAPAPVGAGAGSGSAGPGSAGSGSAGKAGSGSAGAAGSGSGSGAGSGAAVEEQWNATFDGVPVPLAAGETLDADEIQRIVTAAASIDAASPADPKRDASSPNATITIERKAGATSVPPVVIDVIAEGDKSYWVRMRGNDRAVLVDKGRLSDVVGISKDKLVKKPAPPGSTPPAPKLPAGLPSNIPPNMIPPNMPPGMGDDE